MAPKRTTKASGTSKVAKKASAPPTAGVRKSSRARATSSEPRQLRSNSEEPQALQIQDPEQIMRENKRKNKPSSRASSRASTQEPEDNLTLPSASTQKPEDDRQPSSASTQEPEDERMPSSTPEDATVHPTTEIETAPEPEPEPEPESDPEPQPQPAAEPILPAAVSNVATAAIDHLYPHNLSLIMEEPTEESILATHYTRGTFAETVVELSSESDEERYVTSHLQVEIELRKFLAI